MNTCKGITLSGKNCTRMLKEGDYCFQHNRNINKGETRYLQEKPSECPVCRDSLSKQRRSLQCGHWVHKKCVIKSGKAECPVCRCYLNNLGDRASTKIQKIANKRRQELIDEEHDELRIDLQNNIENLITPTLQDHIQTLIDELLGGDDEYNDVTPSLVVNNILQSSDYQELMTALLNSN